MKSTATQYIRSNGEDESVRVEFFKHLEQLVQPVDGPLLQQLQVSSQQIKEPVVDEKTQFQRDLMTYPEVVIEEGVTINSLRIGNIIDA